MLEVLLQNGAVLPPNFPVIALSGIHQSKDMEMVNILTPGAVELQRLSPELQILSSSTLK
jgi:hypothetical protein